MDNRTATTGPTAPTSAVLVLLLVQVFFGALAVIGKVALAHIPALALAAVRVTVAASALWVLQVLFIRERVALRHLPRLAWYSLFGIVANQLFFMLGLERTTPVAASVLVTTIPVFTLVVAAVLGVERLGLRKGAGVAIAFGGVLALVGVSAAAFRSEHAFGNLLVTLNALFFAVYLVLARDLLKVYQPITVATWTFTFGALALLPIGIPSLVSADWAAVPASAWWSLAYVIVFATLATYILNNWALTKVASSTVAVYIYLQPLVAAALAYVIFDTLPTQRTLAGAALIFVGLYLAAVPQGISWRRPPRAARDPAKPAAPDHL